MIRCMWTRVRNQPIIARYFEAKTVLKFYNLEAWSVCYLLPKHIQQKQLKQNR